MSVVGPSESGKTQLIYDMLRGGTFQEPFLQIIYCYRYWQPLYDLYVKNLTAEFVPITDDYSAIDSVISQLGGEKKRLIIFDDVAEEILKNEKFTNLATSGRHKNISVIFVKHNLYQQGKHSVTIDKNTTHIILMRNPRIGRQIKILGTELGNTKFLQECYEKSVAQPYGHLLLDLSQRCPDELRYCSNILASPCTF